MLGPTPVRIYTAGDPGAPGTAPVVLICHGFAGSQQLMTPFAVSLARNGYLAVTFDYLGHGRNRTPLHGDVTEVAGATRSLLEQTAAVADLALALPQASGQLSLLGHSMASDIVVRYALEDPRVNATVAVSMFSPAVTATAPRNLLVIVGGLEGFLKREALRVLGQVTATPRAGVTVVDSEQASARRVVVADGVEHVGVLFSRHSLAEAVAWLNAVYSRRSSGSVDGRGPWIMLLLLGLCALAWPLSSALPRVAEPPRGASLSWRQLLPAALVPALATPLLLSSFPADFLGILVGGYLAMHFAVFGLLTAAAIAWYRRREPRPPADGGRSSWRRLLLASALATAYLAGVLLFALDRYVTSLAITPLRLPLLLFMLAGTLSYFLADEWLAAGAGSVRGGHLFTRSCFLLSLGVAVALSPQDLFFLLIIALVIVIFFFVYGLFSRWIYRATGHPGVGALANATTFAIALTAVFPLMSGP